MNDKLIVPLDTTEKLVTQRTDEEIERDRVIVARMYVRGKSQPEILKELNKLYLGSYERASITRGQVFKREQGQYFEPSLHLVETQDDLRYLQV